VGLVCVGWRSQFREEPSTPLHVRYVLPLLLVLLLLLLLLVVAALMPFIVAG
jgi:hypothetical protein